MADVYEQIKRDCLLAEEHDPIALIMRLMQTDYIQIHGPEHHMLDGACFLTALHNTGVEFDLDAALQELIVRSKKMPGATCGQWGVCGSAASLGAALSILHGTGPLSSDAYYRDNLLYTSQALHRIAEIGGPRCCKRNAFLSIREGIDFVEEHYGIKLPKNEIYCTFSKENAQCIGNRCPFSKEKRPKQYKVAFVCVHNSCRSQIAEALGHQLASDVFESYSAGTETKSEINPDAVRIMKQKYGIDMNVRQHPKLLSELRPVDVVITMGCNVQCPSLPCTYRADWGLPDPTGKEDAAFLDVMQQVENKVLALREELKNL